VTVLYAGFVFFYRPFAREVKRLDSMHRSQLFSHFSESLTGLPTIRAFGQLLTFLANNAKLVDLQNRATILSMAGMDWLYIRLESMGSLLIRAVALMCTVGARTINPSQVALVLNYVIQTTQLLSGLSTVSTMLESASELE
jgi:ABC-type multidrug transport system fused ATPase/permease subunit